MKFVLALALVCACVMTIQAGGNSKTILLAKGLLGAGLLKKGALVKLGVGAGIGAKVGLGLGLGVASLHGHGHHGHHDIGHYDYGHHVSYYPVAEPHYEPLYVSGDYHGYGHDSYGYGGYGEYY